MNNPYKTNLYNLKIKHVFQILTWLNKLRHIFNGKTGLFSRHQYIWTRVDPYWICWYDDIKERQLKDCVDTHEIYILNLFLLWQGGPERSHKRFTFN